MPDKNFPVLMQIEPTVVELTKEDYEIYMGIRPGGPQGEARKDVRQGMGAIAKEKIKPQVRDQGETPKTRQEYIKVLQGRGFEYKHLRSKKLGELRDMY